MMADSADPDSGEVSSRALGDLYQGGTKHGRILGDPEEALRVFKEYKKIAFSEETQREYNEKMDYNDPNVVTVFQV